MYKYGIHVTIYATYIIVDIAHQELFNAKVGKGGINGIKRSAPLTKACAEFLFDFLFFVDLFWVHAIFDTTSRFII